MSESLREVLTRHIDEVSAPPPDLDRVIRRGTRLRRVRVARRLAVVGAVGVVAALVAATTLGGRSGGTAHHEYPRLAAFDLTHGLRAFADPDTDGPLHLGNRSYSTKGMSYLDTDAAATGFGVLFFDHDQKPRLLGSDGQVVSLGPGPSVPTKDFHPSSKMDAAHPSVAWTEAHGDHVDVVLYDLAAMKVVATRRVPCAGTACENVRVDALDHGAAFIRTSAGTFVWRPAADSWTQLGGPGLRVADVRNGTVLYDGSRPTLPSGGWRYVRGPVDAQLTFDGAHVLDWSPVLRPTTKGGHPITLDRGGRGQTAWFTIDTDGSVLMAVSRPRLDPDDPVTVSDVYDCIVPSGHCTRIGEVRTHSGDPEFIGNDM